MERKGGYEIKSRLNFEIKKKKGLFRVTDKMTLITCLLILMALLQIFIIPKSRIQIFGTMSFCPVFI